MKKNLPKKTKFCYLGTCWIFKFYSDDPVERVQKNQSFPRENLTLKIKKDLVKFLL